MWWLAAPLIAGAGKLIYDAVTDDSSSSSSSYSDREERERERETKQQAKEKKNNRIRNEIDEYKNTQKKKIQNKHKVVIEFTSEESTQNNIHGLNGFFGNIFIENEDKVKIISKDKILQNKISNLKKESKELKEAMKELEDIRNETLK